MGSDCPYCLVICRSVAFTHPRRPRGKIIGREEDKTAVSVGVKVYFSCVTFVFLVPDNLAPGSPRMAFTIIADTNPRDIFFYNVL